MSIAWLFAVILLISFSISFQFTRFIDRIRCKHFKHSARLGQLTVIKKRYKLVLSFLRYFQANLNEAFVPVNSCFQALYNLQLLGYLSCGHI